MNLAQNISNNKEIDYSACFNDPLWWKPPVFEMSLTLEVQESDFEFFGTLPEGATCKIRKDTTFSRLKRPPLPPLSKKYKDLKQYEKLLRPGIKAFFNGSLRVVISAFDSNSIQVSGYIPSNPQPILSVRVNSRDLKHCYFARSYCEPYNYMLKIHEKDDMAIVMIQRILRSLDVFTEDPCFALLLRLAKQMAFQRARDELYKDLNDISLCIADILINRGHEDDILAIFHTATSLELAKKYVQTAEICSDIAERDIPRKYPNLSRMRLWYNAGSAFHAALEFIKAEEAFVASLRACGRGWIFDPKYQNNVNNPSFVLHTLIEFYKLVRHVGIKNCKEDTYEMTLRSGYAVCGLISAFNGCKDVYMHNEDTQLVLSCIKNKYRCPKVAFQAALNAFAAPSLDKYRLILSEYMIPNHVLYNMRFNNSIDANQFFKEIKKEYKNFSRKEILSGIKQLPFEKCMSCDNFGEGYKACPCETVRYCSISCQKNHWLIHKKVCPDRQKRHHSSKKKN